MRRRQAGVTLVRRAGAAALAATAAVHGAPVARAGDEWCDSDPVQLIRTDDGRLLPVVVFYTPGARVRSLLDLPRLLALLTGTLLTVRSASQPVPEGTQVTLRVTVPAGAGPAFATRLVVSQGPGGTLTRYAEVAGQSGQEMVAQFLLPAR
jgi:hypothetical protein